jgi:carboxyl-terminal processing protease
MSMRNSCRAIAASGICIALAACASAPVSDHASNDAEPIAPGIAVATFDSLWSKVHDTYVDTAFVATRWMKVRETLRPRAESIAERPALDRLLADALSNIPDSHFYIIPSRVATTDEPGKTKSDGRGTTGLAIRVADGNVVAWRVEPGSPAWNAGIRAGQQVERVAVKDVDSAMRRVRALPEKAQPRALADMLHGMNGLLTPSVGDIVRVVVAGRTYGLAAVPGSGRVSQFGNLPPIAGLVKKARIPSKSPHGCVGLVAFNIWLPALVSDLDQAIDSVRSCDGIVVDLRGNPGGVGAMVMGFGGYFVDSTRSLGAMRTRQVTLNFVINPRSSRFTGPLAILVDPMTASTSEIFAAGMQRIGRARVFGETSAGAALPALMERLPSGDVFVHAVADFTDPTGRRIEGAGAVPDEIVSLKVSDLAAGRDAPLDAAVRWIEGKKQ